MSIISTVPKGAAVEGINPNLLRNWYFVGGGTGRGVFPVNTRGASSYAWAGGDYRYAMDGWRGAYPQIDLTLISSGLQITYVNTSQGGNLDQQINLVSGLTYTASALTSLGLLTSTATVSSTISSGNPSLSTTKFRVHFSPVQLNCIVYAVKVELGDQQTLCHQESGVWVLNEIPDYEEELIKCQTSTADPSDTYANKVLSTNIPNKNLLDNWYFQNPVNQRGQSSYSTDGAYTIDRWKLGGAAGTASVSNQGILLTNTTAISQYFEQSRILSGKTYTMSVLWSNGLSTATGTLTHGTQTSGWQIVAGGTITTARTCGIRVFNSNTFQMAIFGDGTNRVIAAKLELGTEQTLAHQENGIWVLNEIPNYEEELIKCQRYLQPVLLSGYDGGGLQNCMARWLSSSSQFQVMVWLRLSPQMHSAPTSLVNTLNASARVVFFDTKNGTVTATPAVTSFGLNSGASPISAYIYAVTGSAQSAVDNGVYQYEIDAANASSGGLFISAEL